MKRIKIAVWGSLCCLFLHISCSQSEYKGEPQITITPEQANVLEENWKQTRAPAITQRLSRQDAREFVFTLESLKEYIAYVEHKRKELGVTQEPGIRVYLGAYPDRSAFGDAGSATIFLAPVHRKEKPTSDGPQARSSETDDSWENTEGINPANMAHAGKPPKEYDGN